MPPLVQIFRLSKQKIMAKLLLHRNSYQIKEIGKHPFYIVISHRFGASHCINKSFKYHRYPSRVWEETGKLPPRLPWALIRCPCSKEVEGQTLNVSILTDRGHLHCRWTVRKPSEQTTKTTKKLFLFALNAPCALQSIHTSTRPSCQDQQRFVTLW